MSLFSKVFAGEPPVSVFEIDPGRYAEAEEPVVTGDTPFMSYIKDVVIYGAPQIEEASVENIYEKVEAEDSEPEDSEPEDSEPGDSDPYLTYSYEDEHSYEDENEDEEIAAPSIDEMEQIGGEEQDTASEEPVTPKDSTYALAEQQLQVGRADANPAVFHASSVTQKDDVQVQRIVDGLFDRMKVVWGPDKTKQPLTAPQRKSPRSTALAQKKSHPLTESKSEISNLIRREIPQAMRGELATIMRTEIMKVVRTEIVRVVREEFETLRRSMEKTLDQLHAIESRMARIEGAVGQEVKLNFPKGMVKIDSPVSVTVPEREVKVAAPINVQPPSVTFDEGAINVTFNKTGGKREVRFDRDPHDQCIKSAEIIDVPST